MKTALRDYREFMKSGIDSKTLAFYGKKKQSSILGDPDFLEMIKEKYILTDRKLSTEIPEERKVAGVAMTEQILKEVSKSFSLAR